MKTIVHIVPHAHWDREWYLPLEAHRARLLDQIDSVLELLKNDPAYTYHLDGQMIAVEDYLSMRPERKPDMERFINEGRLHIGPWYVLQDEYLTSGEANVRNLLRGLREAERFSRVCAIGYLPDAFGNVSQMPQLLRQAKMQAAVFGRGVTLCAENADPAEHFPRYSEFLWESPDGSAIPALFFSGWYNNAQEIPTDPGEAKAYWDARLERARKYASTEHLLFMNGSDHQPAQKNLEAALKTARMLYPEIEFRCSDLETFAACVLQDRTEAWETVSGELAGQQTDGSNTLCNTASSRAPIKTLNRENESQLALVTEPLLVMSFVCGYRPDTALLKRAWKLLIANHPHDSICCCGIDDVHRETVYRYEKSLQLARLLSERAGVYLSGKIAAKAPEDAAAFVLCNPSAWERNETVTVTVGVDRIYGTRDACLELSEKPGRDYMLTNPDGKTVPCGIEDLGVCFGYDLPEDRFRQPYFERRFRLTFFAEHLPAFGYASYFFKPGKSEEKPGMRTGANSMENSRVRVEIRENGTFDLLDKATGRMYTGLGLLEDTGDVGDEYIFRAATDEPVLSKRGTAVVTCIEDAFYRTAFLIETHLRLPVSADEALGRAQNGMQPRLEREISRSRESAEAVIYTTLSLEPDSPMVRIRIELDNQIKDHRLRMLFPTDFAGQKHFADSVFDVIERPDVPGRNWKNPSRCQRMQYFAAAEDGENGLAVLNRGIYEYEILPDRKTIAVTILRSVGELGDWGVFSTPGAQCIGTIRAELAVLPYADGEFLKGGCRQACLFQTEPVAFRMDKGGGTLPKRANLFSFEGDGLAVTALKPSEDGNGIILRAVNVTDTAQTLTLQKPEDAAVWESDILERKKEMLTAEDGSISVPVGVKEIKTVRMEICRE